MLKRSHWMKVSVFWAAFAVFYIITIYPLISLKYIPFLDYSEHLAASAAIKNIILGGPLSDNFQITGFFPNILSWSIIALISIFFDILTAGKIFVLSYFLLTPLSIYYFLEKDKKHLTLLSFLFLNNQPLNMGFMNYIIAIPLIFLALGAFKRKSRFFYLFAFLIFFSHAYAYGVFAVLFIIFYRYSKIQNRNTIAYVLIILLLVIAGVLFPAGAAHSTGGNNPLTIDNAAVAFLSGPILTISNYLVYAFQYFRPDYYLIAGFIGIILIYGRQIFWERRYDKRILYSVIALYLIVLLTPPDLAFGSNQIPWYSFSTRLIPVAVLLNLCDLKIKKNFVVLITIIFLFLSAAQSLTISPLYQATDMRLARNFEPVLKAIPAGSRLYAVRETEYVSGYFLTSKNTYGVDLSLTFFGGYHSLRGGYSSDYFGVAYPLLWPVGYKTDLYYPLCKANVSKTCLICTGAGAICFNSSECLYCHRPLEVVCLGNESGNEEDKFIMSNRCVQCLKSDLNCILDNPRIKENFDFVVAYSMNDDINKFLVDRQLYAFSPDVIVYKVENNPKQPSQT